MEHYPRVEIHSHVLTKTVYANGQLDDPGHFHATTAKITLQDGSCSVVIVGQVNNEPSIIEKCVELMGVINPKVINFFVEDCLMPITSGNVLDITLSPDVDVPINEIEAAVKIANGRKFKIFACEHIAERRVKRYDFDINYFDWFMAFHYPLQNLNISYKSTPDFSKKITCLNNRPTTSRTAAVSYLRNFPEHVVLSSRFNLDKAMLNDPRISGIDEHIQSLIQLGAAQHKNDSDNQNVNDLDSIERSVDLYSQSFCALVTETKFFSDFQNFTEKTAKAIVAKRPFILLAPPLTLKMLRVLNFKTFANIIDESYDKEKDHAKRLEKVLLETTRIMRLPHEELRKMYDAAEPILDHNRAALHNLKVTMTKFLKDKQ